MFEVLQQLPNVTQTQGDQRLLGKQYQQTYSIQGCYKPSICKKNAISANLNKMPA